MKLKSILLTAVATLGLTASTIAQVPNYVPTNGLVGWWPFNGNANDESGNNNNGTVNGATLTTDRFGNTGKAYGFDGLSWIEFSPISASTGNNGATLTGWFFRTQNPSGVEYIVGYGNPNFGEVFATGEYGPQGGFSTFFGGAYDAISNQAFGLNSWHHIASVHSGNGNVKIYLDGMLFYSANVGVPNIQNSIGRIGRAIWQSSEFWHGSLDDIAIWNRALTSTEITALYTSVPTDNNETSNTTTNVPDAISYQAVARNSQGAPLADTNVQVQFILLADSLTGAAEYSETHTLTTNSLGLFTTAFGAGSPINGSFSGIDWSAGNKYVNVQINTGSGWVDMGTQQLLSTPYSMHSATSGAIKNPGLPVYADNAAAIAGGLVAGDMYRTSAGILMVVY